MRIVPLLLVVGVVGAVAVALLGAPPAVAQGAPRDVRFVAAATAVVRAEPNDDARTVVEAAIGAPVAVVKIEGAWARVLVGPRVFRFDSLESDGVALAPRAFDQRLPQGFVRTDELTAYGAGAPTRVDLLAQAKALEVATGAGAAPSAGTTPRGALMLRAWALDPHDADVARAAAPLARTAKPMTSRRERPVERADLVFGCAGDLARATVVGGAVSSLGAARAEAAGDVCVAGLDPRPPCDAAQARVHKAEMARLVPRYGNDGPALRLVLGPGAGARAVYVVTRLLEVDGCVDCAATAATTEVRVARLRVPRVENGTTVLHVLVPRAQGVLYSVVAADSRDDVEDEGHSFELGEAFDADPRDEAGPGAHVFAAPDVCSCTCDDDPGEDGDVDDSP